MNSLLQTLISKGVLDEETAQTISREAETSDSSIEQLLLTHGVSEEDILQARGEHWDLPVKMLQGGTIPYDVLKYIPEESARHYRILPLGIVDNTLEVGIVDPDNIEALDALNFISTQQGIPFKVFLISESDYKKGLQTYDGVTNEVGKALKALSTQEDGVQDGGGAHHDTLGTQRNHVQNLDDLEQRLQDAERKEGESGGVREEAPITKIVATILRSAIEERASDIHVEPQREKVRVRYRIDGVLQQSLVLPAKVQQAVIARIKILSNIKLDEKRKPQDGRFSATINGRRIDFRVSTMPTYYGEKAVLRILDSERAQVTLEDLGMDERQLKQARKAIKAPYGMILITGPTGSGKSTSLYAMLNEVDRDHENVLSLEDPVEYNIDGVSQSQVRPEIGYTFASGIRSVLRQDPDIIMVGEIRDQETARLAVQAALTGHLVFSTLHTNSAAGAIPRLVDMGVDPYLLAPTLVLVVAQRLVRRICPDTGRSIPIKGPIKKMLDEQFADLPEQYRSTIPHAKEFLGVQPTGSCPTGTRGRIGVYEMLEINDEIRQAVLKGADEAILYRLARKHGMLTLKEDAIKKAMQKIIPFEDIAQVAGVLDVEEEDTSNKGQIKNAEEKEPSTAQRIQSDKDLV